jgi:hypothetical protein
MRLIKKIHYYIVYFTLRYKKIDKHFAKVMAEQYIFFKYNK